MSILKSLLESHPEWIAPRSDQHTVIGLPGSRDHRKTFVEPGGSFSPGVGTFGVTVWLYDHENGKLHAPEEMAAGELSWQWEDGYYPLLHSRWAAGGTVIRQTLLADSVKGLENIVNSQRIVVEQTSPHAADVSLYIVIRPYGAAGGGIASLNLASGESIIVNGKLVMLAKQPADARGALSYQSDQAEISEWLRQGKLPDSAEASDWQHKLCSGALSYRMRLGPGEQHTLSFDWFVHPLEHDYEQHFRIYHKQEFAAKAARVKSEWQERLHQVKLSVPDVRFRDAYYSMLAQFLMATVGHDARIATITYPLFWLRDGVYIINALDKAGLHQEVRQQLEQLRGRLFAGGFGAEPDAFGEAIWPFYNHYRLTNDEAWLRDVYPDLKLRAEWIVKARHTKDYLYDDVEMRVPDQRNSAGTDLICEPARDGLIMGRMDWHRPTIWINAFSLLGLRAMAEMAAAIGLSEDAARYGEEAKQLEAALDRYALEHFGENERDYVCAFWPTNAFSSDSVHLLEKFESWWSEVRLQGKEEYKAEPLWKYFEVGQAHNYLLIGDRDKTWTTLEYYLNHHDVDGLYGWLEDNHDIAEFWSRIEGWYKLPSRQPHGWVSSELYMMMRDMLLYEKGETLVLGEGIPEAWMGADCPIELLQAPSHFGPVDFMVKRTAGGELAISVRFHEADRLPNAIDIRLPWQEEELTTSLGAKPADRLIIDKPLYATNGWLQFTVGNSE